MGLDYKLDNKFFREEGRRKTFVDWGKYLKYLNNRDLDKFLVLAVSSNVDYFAIVSLIRGSFYH